MFTGDGWGTNRQASPVVRVAEVQLLFFIMMIAIGSARACGGG